MKRSGGARHPAASRYTIHKMAVQGTGMAAWLVVKVGPPWFPMVISDLKGKTLYCINSLIHTGNKCTPGTAMSLMFPENGV